jgi:hypothetical protein
MGDIPKHRLTTMLDAETYKAAVHSLGDFYDKITRTYRKGSQATKRRLLLTTWTTLKEASALTTEVAVTPKPKLESTSEVLDLQCSMHTDAHRTNTRRSQLV